MTIRVGSPFPGNSNCIYVRGLIDTTDPTTSSGAPKYINDASGTWDIRTAAGTPAAAGGSSAASGNFTAVGSGGNYRGDIADTVTLVAGTTYYLRKKLTTTGGYVYFTEEPWTPATRTGATTTS
jgi:hypothetical protein